MMKSPSSKKRKIISATIGKAYLLWLENFSHESGQAKSRLIEEGIRLLQEKIKEEQHAHRDVQIDQGIDRILASGEDQQAIAEPPNDFRSAGELL